jgi:hypothetical protein
VRIIIHADRAEDAIMGARAVTAAIRDGHDAVIYSYGTPVDYSVYVRTNKTGFTAYVTSKAVAEGASE